MVYLSEKEVLKILAESHKIIAKEVYDKIKTNYNVELDSKKMFWGSIAPDYLPYYKLIRHYQDESLNYIATEIVKLIFMYKNTNFNTINPMLLKHLSKKIGIISHYLCDYTCYPHAYRMTFMGSMKSHIKYEVDLNVYAKDYEFKRDVINTESINIYDNSDIKLVNQVMAYINAVVNEYKASEKSFETDLNYALNLSENVACFIMETILNYSENMEYQFI